MKTVLIFALFLMVGQSWAINCWKQNMDISMDANKMEKEKCEAATTHCLWYSCEGKDYRECASPQTSPNKPEDVCNVLLKQGCQCRVCNDGDFCNSATTQFLHGGLAMAMGLGVLLVSAVFKHVVM